MDSNPSSHALRSRQFLDELPVKPDYEPVAHAISLADEAGDETTSAALQLFRSMPASTGIIANPVLYRPTANCLDATLQLRIRAFTIRGLLSEEDIVTGAADALRVIFVGLFGRLPTSRTEEGRFASLIHRHFFAAIQTQLLEQLAQFFERFPSAPPEVALQYCACLQKADLAVSHRVPGGVRASRRPTELLTEMIRIHLSHVAAAACASYMRRLLEETPNLGPERLSTLTGEFVDAARLREVEPFRVCFSLLLGRAITDVEAEILERMGTIQIHHGSAGSSMVARYFASLETPWTSDLFLASQMAMDGRRHFGAIHDMSDFVDEVEDLSSSRRAAHITERLLGGNLPTFGHPEIAAAGRSAEIELDPRPALYLEPLFRAIDAGHIELTRAQQKRLSVAVDMYTQALVSGVRKPGSEQQPPLRLTPNTDFGAWCVQEALGVTEPDRTCLSYLFRGFGWMMDAREQLQQRIIRPVIPPDPRILPEPIENSDIPRIAVQVHDRLTSGSPFKPH